MGSMGILQRIISGCFNLVWWFIDKLPDTSNIFDIQFFTAFDYVCDMLIKLDFIIPFDTIRVILGATIGVYALRLAIDFSLWVLRRIFDVIP